MAKVCILGNWHAGSNAAQYARAFRLEGHDVTTVGPRYTFDDWLRWEQSLKEMEWPPDSIEAHAYAYKVMAESQVPDVVTEKGGWYSTTDDDGFDLIVRFEAYGETPRLDADASSAPRVVVYGDTHTGHLDEYVKRANYYDHVFVQFRRSDLDAFDHPSKHWLPAAADPDTWIHAPDTTKDIDCLFVGSTHPQIHKDRVDLLHFLKCELGDKRVVVKHAFGTDAALLMNRAKVVLNRSLAGDLNMRVPEVLCTGAHLVTDAVDGLERFKGQYWRYRTPGEALEQIGKALQHLPDGEARLDVRAQHTYRHRAQWLLSAVGLEKTGMAGPGTAGLGRARRGWAGADSRLQIAIPGREGETRAGLPVRAAEPAAVAADSGVAPVLCSVIIPCFNHWQMTSDLLRILSPEHNYGYEILVVDDGSDDETAIRDEFPAPGTAIRILHKPNGGFASAVNYGAQHAKGTYLVVLNNDCRPAWHGAPERKEHGLKPLLEQLEDPTVGIVGVLILNPDGSVNSAGLWTDPDGVWGNYVGSPSESASDVPAVTGACFAVRRDVFLRLGGLDEAFGNGGCDDVDACLRARKAGYRVVLEPRSRVVHHEGTTRFALPDIQERIRKSQERLHERWGLVGDLQILGTHRWESPAGVPAAGPCVVDDRGADGARDVSRPVGGGVSGKRPGESLSVVETLDVGWIGPTDPAVGGSLAVINAALCSRLDQHGLRLIGPEKPAPYVRVDVLHYFPGTAAHTIPAWAMNLAVIQPWELGVPPEAWRQTWAHQAFRELWVPSVYCKDLYRQYQPETENFISVIPNGVDLDVFTPEGEQWPHDESLFRFLFVGGAIWRKGIDLLLEAWAEAFRDDEPVRLALKLAGSKTFYRQSQVPGRTNTIRVLDADFSPAELASIYRSCDVVVQPSRAEAFCLPVLEAMAMNKPVIAPAYGPTTEYAGGYALTPRTRWKEDERGLYYEVDVHDLARCLRYAYESKSLRANGRGRACAYGWDRIASQYAGAIRRVARA